jgi:predicted O-linked N-acetylglucosamine transferase (SPINDLY family)
MNQGTALKLNQARALFISGDAPAALRILEQELRRHPADPDLCGAAGLVLTQLGQGDRALFYLQKAAAARPRDPGIHTNLGNLLAVSGRTEGAEAAFRAALAAAPSLVEAHVGLANTLRTRRRFTEALKHVQAALRHRPDSDDLVALAAALLGNLARIPEAVALCEERLAACESEKVALMHAFSLLYMPGATGARRLESHRRYARLLARRFPRRAVAPPPGQDPDRKLRIGMLSHELRQHAVAGFLEPWLAHRDRARAELVAFNLSSAADATTARFRGSFDAWHDVAALDEGATFDLISRERIDILVDTCGLTQGNRIGVIAMKPAPVQVMLLGYLSTTGLDTLDARIADSTVEPAADRACSAERVIHLDPTYLAWRPPEDAPPPAPPPSGAAGHITFGSFNQTPKLNDALLALWARTVNAVPGARLLVKAIELEDPGLRESLAHRLAAAGLARDRLTLEGPTWGARALLAEYARVDVALDTAPFSGTATTLDALLMGVPVVTLPVASHAGRTGLGILSAIGMHHWIARDEEGYVAAAAALAADAGLRAELRTPGPRSLRSRLEASPIRDERAHAARLDAALRALWRERCDAASPASGGT